MSRERTFRVVWVASGHGTGVPPTEEADAVVRYRGKPLTIAVPHRTRRADGATRGRPPA
jgi:hypothetical protein